MGNGMIRWSPEQLDAHRAKTLSRRPAPLTVVPALAGKERLQALGRLKVGEMNKTEAAYGAVLEQRKRIGEVAWYRFEGLKFRLADKTFYTPDFAVQLSDGSLEAHEVKGGVWEDDARVKIKVASEMYPIRFVAVRKQAKKDGGGWELEEF